MKMLRDVLICLLLLTLCVSATIGALSLKSIASDLHSTNVKLADDLHKLLTSSTATSDDIHKQLTSKYGLLPELTAAARESRKTIDVLQKTSLAERKKLASLSDASIQAVNELTATISKAGVAVQGVQAVTDSANKDVLLMANTITAATSLISTADAGTKESLDRTVETIGHLDSLVVAAGPIEASAADAVRHVDASTVSADQILADGAAYIHTMTHPAKRGFWSQWAIALLGPTARVVLDHIWPVRVTVVK